MPSVKVAGKMITSFEQEEVLQNATLIHILGTKAYRFFKRTSWRTHAFSRSVFVACMRNIRKTSLST